MYAFSSRHVYLDGGVAFVERTPRGSGVWDPVALEQLLAAGA